MDLFAFLRQNSKRIMLILAIFLMSAFLLSIPRQDRAEPNSPEKSEYITGVDGKLYIVDFDGHKFVVYDGYRAGGLAHHPECQNPVCIAPK